MLTRQQQLEAITLWNEMFDGVWVYWLAEEDDDVQPSLPEGENSEP